MGKRLGDQEYRMIGKAAEELGISVSTLRRYIRGGAFPAAKRVFYGRVGYQVFSDDYLKQARKQIEVMRESKK